MTKIAAAAVLLWTQVPLKVQAWAPIGNLPYTQLPKTFEFAEKVIWLPKTDELNGVQRLPEEQRTLPWFHQERELQTNYFFDGYSGEVNEWPTREAFLLQESQKKAQKLTPKVEATETLDYFYDGMGNLISWDVPKKQDELYYFDGIGTSLAWSSSVVAPPAQKKEVMPKKETLEAADYYYDDMGNLVSWSIPSQDEKYYFDGIGASHVWSNAKPKTQTILKKKAEALEVADHYYDDMGNLVSWSVPSQDGHHYFDGIGASQVWSTATPKTETILKKKEEALEAADHYYDDMGNLVSWSVPRQEAEEKHYFEDIGTSRVWQKTIDVMSATTESLLQKDPVAMLGNLGIMDEDCAHSYYSDTGDLMCWVGA